MRKLVKVLAVVAAGTLLLSGCTTIATREAKEKAEAKIAAREAREEFPVGKPKEFQNMVRVSAFYTRPADMAGANMGLSAAESDVHLEAEIVALEDNHLDLAYGEWIPYLTVEYEIEAPGGAVTNGTFMPMLSNHGLHYGSNVKLGGAGTYRISYRVHSPVKNGLVIHSDPATGVEGSFWESPLEAEWSLNFMPHEW
ncbi:MAG: iron transporter [Propioniciclava sp.]|uniref:iron transporter n=1 Tax=Propioniciclava sp. TaxID=2038686 RepID=UPI0039E2FE61